MSFSTTCIITIVLCLWMPPVLYISFGHLLKKMTLFIFIQVFFSPVLSKTQAQSPWQGYKQTFIHKKNLLSISNRMFVNVNVFTKLVYFTEMLLIKSPGKYLSVTFLFNNHDIHVDKGDIQQQFLDNMHFVIIWMYDYEFWW